MAYKNVKILYTKFNEENHLSTNKSQSKFNIGFLSGNVLKIIAIVSMTIDHIGMILFPSEPIFRIIGRLAFPIFAFFIGEGCKYTKNKLKYFLTVFIVATIYQVVYLIFVKDWFFNVLFTFSLSILIIYALQFVKKSIMNRSSKIIIKISSLLIFVSSIVIVFYLNKYLTFDYGFWGCLLPVFASIMHYEGNNIVLKSIDSKFLNLLVFSIGLLLIVMNGYGYQEYSLLSLILLVFYSNKRGKVKMKYFFYLYYGIHLGVLYLIQFIM